MSESQDYPEECDGCHYAGAPLESYERGPTHRGTPDMRLCALCAGTKVGRAVDDPRAYGANTVEMMRTVCYVGNVILAALKERR